VPLNLVPEYHILKKTAFNTKKTQHSIQKILTHQCSAAARREGVCGCAAKVEGGDAPNDLAIYTSFTEWWSGAEGRAEGRLAVFAVVVVHALTQAVLCFDATI
jgi:hypothetical protein